MQAAEIVYPPLNSFAKYHFTALPRPSSTHHYHRTRAATKWCLAATHFASAAKMDDIISQRQQVRLVSNCFLFFLNCCETEPFRFHIIPCGVHGLAISKFKGYIACLLRLLLHERKLAVRKLYNTNWQTRFADIWHSRVRARDCARYVNLSVRRPTLPPFPSLWKNNPMLTFFRAEKMFYQ